MFLFLRYYFVSPQPVFASRLNPSGFFFLETAFFIVGEGYTHHLWDFAKKRVLITKRSVSGRHPLGVEFFNYGRIPLNLPKIAADNKIHALIRSGQFDYVILEGRRSGFLLPEWAGLPDNRGQSISYEDNMKALGAIHRTVVESGAQTVLYMHPGLRMHPDIKQKGLAKVGENGAGCPV